MPEVFPYVFVHGLFGPFRDPLTFSRLEPAPCSAPDLRGYGANAADRAVSPSDQLGALAAHIDARHPSGPVHLVAHSIGAVHAFLYADGFPERVASVTTVEGNFSLADAFWSRAIAALDAAAARDAIEERLADPAAFLRGDGIEPTPILLERAKEALAYQPWETVWLSARAVVGTTARDDYIRMLQRVFSRTAVHLLAGQRSAGGWHVPGWARSAAKGDSVIPGTGHMIMLEDPAAFGDAIAEVISGRPRHSRAATRLAAET